ncbi:hypothetical protein EV385_3755 [Krasilnikovia cinnamomea]|uniref:Uncharacterized protein n=1 Tax=Krasilnikovia cinnamomea TaxID=349313 RepID=A0A4Q7ZLS1_9ACTN|nr:hypothetical protein [Krasilnikovia cinnamomea]RZU51918.1 hypothetical protein EV385_3755 [Krasilnikovia cinnamomea]
MSVSGWTVGIGLAVGVGLTAMGVTILATRRMPAATARTFRDARAAGLYHLLFGLALLILVLGLYLPGSAASAISAGLAVALVAVAVVRFRPRGRRSSPDDEDGEGR